MPQRSYISGRRAESAGLPSTSGQTPRRPVVHLGAGRRPDRGRGVRPRRRQGAGPLDRRPWIAWARQRTRERQQVEAEAVRRRLRAELVAFALEPAKHDAMTFRDPAIWTRVMRRAQEPGGAGRQVARLPAAARCSICACRPLMVLSTQRTPYR